MSFREKSQFMMALLIAGLFSWRDPKHSLKRIGKAFWLWTGLLWKHEKFAPDDLAAKRFAVCQTCPVFWPHLGGTCGSPLAKDRGELGCHCFMKFKSKLTEATCWLDDEDMTDLGGWKANGV